eukprot:5732004-Prymnesium_polylepis.2
MGCAVMVDPSGCFVNAISAVSRTDGFDTLESAQFHGRNNQQHHEQCKPKEDEEQVHAWCKRGRVLWVANHFRKNKTFQRTVCVAKTVRAARGRRRVTRLDQ